MTMIAPTAAYQATAGAAAPASGKDWPGNYRGTQGPAMLGHQTERRHWIADSMTTRSTVLLTIALLAVLLAGVALASLFAGDISERAGSIVTTVLGSFATVLAGLLLFLRVETVNAKVDDAASHAETAARKAAVVEKKVDGVHHDLLNGGLRENVIRAIRETETDPEITQQRADNAARGVRQDRHAKAQRDTITINRAELDELKRRLAQIQRDQAQRMEAVALDTNERLRRGEIGRGKDAVVSKAQADDIQSTGEDTNERVRAVEQQQSDGGR